MTKILYVQFTAAANYPPLIASSGILADGGCEVRILGVEADGSAGSLRMAPHPRIAEANLARGAARLSRAAGYPRFLARARAEIARWRPDIVYCSDERSYPIGLWASTRTGCRTVLHEHDPPGEGRGGIVGAVLRQARRRFAQRATVCVIPQDERAKTFHAETGASRVAVVYNCPRVGEVRVAVERTAREGFTLWYHGAIGPKQLPPQIVDALALCPGDVRLAFAGYETLSSQGYAGRLMERAREHGISDRVQYHGPVPERAEMLRHAAGADAGLALFSRVFRDPMVGASNKPFDYLACGLPLLINDTPEWGNFYGAEGVAVSCDPADPADIARAVMALRDDPARCQGMAARGEELIRTRWNYEAQFAKVIEALGIEMARKPASPH